MISQIVPHLRFLTVPTFIGALAILLGPNAKAPVPPPKHGLTGNYYVGTSGWTKDTPGEGFVQIWTDWNDFRLPRAFTPPATTRIDAQIAFGQGKGFHVDPNISFPPSVVWWPTGYALPPDWAKWHPASAKPWDEFAAVIWKGYIHFPKAGTYYLATISNGGSAVYLNQARVALNAGSGRVLAADAFTYAKEQIQDFVQLVGSAFAFEPQPKAQYIIPVTIDAPRDLPIEVRYTGAETPSGHARAAFGIDLFWLTPDSPRDSNGKPIASIVPSDALYTEPPNPIEKPVVRGANSMVSADFLYFPVEAAEGAVTLTVRLADKDGNPVRGKRVYVSSVVSSGASVVDAIAQPEKATDDKGETTAKIRANPAYPYSHDSTIFATDVSDFVDLAQVAHVTFQPVELNFFEPFSPYYDRSFSITPDPPVVGRPTLIKTMLKNHSKFPATVTVTFLTTDLNLGFTNWAEIAKVKDFTLQPGESKEVSTTFTPKEVSGHKCYRVDVSGRYSAMNSTRRNVFAAAQLPASKFLDMALANSPDQPANGKQQFNTSTVASAPLKPPFIPFPLGPPCKGVPHIAGGTVNPTSGLTEGGVTVDEDGTRCTPSPKWKRVAKNWADKYQTEWVNRGCLEHINHPEDVTDVFKESCNELVQLNRDNLRMYHDPPDTAYRRLAVAGSGSAAGYLDAWRRSWERYQAAREENDTEWMAKHATAIQIYVVRMSRALRQDADEREKQASKLPPDDANTQAQLNVRQERLQDWLRKGARLTDEQRNRWHAAGFTDTEIQEIIKGLSAAPEKVQLKADRALLFEIASLHRDTVDEVEHLDTSPTAPEVAAAPGQPLAQVYAVANPHDREENIDLLIRPISIPPNWKLSIVNAEESQTQGQAAKPASDPPKYPVREVEAGKHYAVSLPAKAEVKVASLLIPVGELGAHTTARWAVEGKIGTELIGGMVHEMTVPYIIADLQLPPVGSKEEEEELPAPFRPWARIITEVAVGIVVLGLVAYFFIFWRKRRQAHSA